MGSLVNSWNIALEYQASSFLQHTPDSSVQIPKEDYRRYTVWTPPSGVVLKHTAVLAPIMYRT